MSAIVPPEVRAANVVASRLPFYTLEGDARTLKAYRGQLVILNIFATWCQPCKEEIPDLNRLARNGRGRWVVLSVGVDIADSKAAKVFVKQYGIRYPLFYDPGEKFTSEFPVRGFPYFALILPDGTIEHQMLGPQNWEHSKMIEYLNSLTQATGGPHD